MKQVIFGICIALCFANSAASAGDTTGASLSCGTAGNEVFINLKYSYLDIKDYNLKSHIRSDDGRLLGGYSYLTGLWQRPEEMKLSMFIVPDGRTEKVFVDFESKKSNANPKPGKISYEGNVTITDLEAGSKDVIESACEFVDGGNEE